LLLDLGLAWTATESFLQSRFTKSFYEVEVKGVLYMVTSGILAAFTDLFAWYQIPLLLLLIVVIVLYVIYRRKQM
jgi:F0F1-type ATP synthase assembly protein I